MRTADLVTAWAGTPVLVVGDAVLYRWLAGQVAGCARGAAAGDRRRRTRHAAGGAANTAVNLAAMGARVRLVAAVGADPAGERCGRDVTRDRYLYPHRSGRGRVITATRS